MTTRWSASGLLIGAVLLLAGCGHEEGPRAGANDPSTAATSPTSRPTTSEQIAVKDAEAAFRAMLRATDAASQDPGSKDWEPAVRQYAADPAAYLSIQSIRDLATLDLRQEGSSRVDLTVAAVDLKAAEGPTVKLTGCYDSQSTKVVKVQTGEVVPPGTPPRYVWAITVIQYVAEPGSPWLVEMLEPRTDQSC